jgi:hypothetical protein
LQGREDLVTKLDEAIDLLEKLEMLVSRLKPGDNVQAGLVYQLYQSLMLLREKILEARLTAVQKDRPCQ